jgi:hypothetical protein
MTSKEFYEVARGNRVQKGANFYVVVGYVSGGKDDLILYRDDTFFVSYLKLKNSWNSGYIPHFPDGEPAESDLINFGSIYNFMIVKDNEGFIGESKMVERVFPHKCSVCRSPCLNLFSSTECSNKHCEKYVP